MEYEVLTLVDDLADIEFMSEMAVTNSMIDAYMKQAIMLEYASEEVVQECCYVQEGLMDDIKVGAKGVKGENVLKKILLFIPRLIASIVKWIKNKFSKTPQQTVDTAKKAVDAVKSLDNDQAEVLEAAAEVIDNSVKRGTPPTDEECQKAAAKFKEKMHEVIAERPDLQVPGKGYKGKDGDIHMTVDKNTEIYIADLTEAIKTTATYISYNRSLPKSKKHPNYHDDNMPYAQRHKLIDRENTFKNVIRLAREGKIQTNIDVDYLNKLLEYWNQILTQIEKAIAEFDKNNVPKFDKTINQLYQKHTNKAHGSKNGFASGMASSPKGLDIKNGVKNGYRHTLYGGTFEGDVIPVDEFGAKIGELSKLTSGLIPRLRQVMTRIDEEDGDIGEFTKRRARDDNKRITNNVLEKHGVDSKTATDGVWDEVDSELDKSNIQKLALAFGRIRDMLGGVSHDLMFYDRALTDCKKIYGRVIKLAKSIKHQPMNSGKYHVFDKNKKTSNT